MEEKLAKAEKQVLVDIVKLAQKRGMKGSKGEWKDFLNIYDKLRGSCIGSCLSDPARRDNKALISFLKTFTDKDDLKFFERVLQCHLNGSVVEQLKKERQNNECPEQRLVRLTLQHPFYPSDYAFPSHEEGWVCTKLRKKSKVIRANAMVAVDCEMVLCEDGTEALVKICVVDRDLQVKVNQLVNPNKAVADFRTEITGVSEADLVGVTCSLTDIQKTMKELLSGGTILVGHSLNNDLKALKVDHAIVIDSSYIFKYSDALIHKRPSLNSLCKSVLGYEVREQGAPHNCLNDARAAMNLVLAILDHGVDNSIPLVRDVPISEMAKLLIHRIPVNVSGEELCSLIPGDVRIEKQSSKKAQSESYSALAIFRSPEEAEQAFEEVHGDEGKDSNGLPQKLVEFQSRKGLTARIFIRKMVCEDLSKPPGKKRASQVEEKFIESKKLKIEQDTVEETFGVSKQSDSKMKEIERLKQEVKEKDAQIVMKDEIISELQNKVDKMKKWLKEMKDALK